MRKIMIFLTAFIFSSYGLVLAQGLRPKHTVLVSTFPIYQIVRNVTNGSEALDVVLMLPSGMGCPHDYALTYQDMQKIAKAEVLVINGLGMEEFLGAPLKAANPSIKVIDSSEGIEELLYYEEEKYHHHEKGNHHHGRVKRINPHLFVSPRMNGLLALNIAKKLSEFEPSESALYTKNAQVYSENMFKLMEEMNSLGKKLKNNRVVQPHGVFDYLFKEMGIEIVATLLPHGHEPPVSEIRKLINLIKKEDVGAIFLEPQYPKKIGELISKETGVPLYILDPCTTGPEDAGLDYYEKVMRKNIKVFEEMLGALNK